MPSSPLPTTAWGWTGGGGAYCRRGVAHAIAFRGGEGSNRVDECAHRRVVNAKLPAEWVWHFGNRDVSTLHAEGPPRFCDGRTEQRFGGGPRTPRGASAARDIRMDRGRGSPDRP